MPPTVKPLGLRVQGAWQTGYVPSWGREVGSAGGDCPVSVPVALVEIPADPNHCASSWPPREHSLRWRAPGVKAAHSCLQCDWEIRGLGAARRCWPPTTWFVAAFHFTPMHHCPPTTTILAVRSVMALTLHWPLGQFDNLLAMCSYSTGTVRFQVM